MPKWLLKALDKVPFNRGKPKVQLAVIGVLIVLLVAGATVARAESNMQFGVGSAVVRGETGVADISISYPDAGPGDAGYEIGATFIGASALHGELQRQNFAWRAAVVDGFGRFDVGIGVAYLQNIDTYNGSHTNFTLLIGYRFKRWPLFIRAQHFSNGGTVSPNKGRDLIFVGWRFE